MGKECLRQETQSRAEECSRLKETKEMLRILDWILHLDQIQRGKKKNAMKDIVRTMGEIRMQSVCWIV